MDPRRSEGSPGTFWERLEEHERPQLDEYLDLILRDTESICEDFNPSRRHEFFRLLAKGLGRAEPPYPGEAD